MNELHVADDEIDLIAERAAQRAIEKTFAGLGLDITTPRGMRDAQDDFRYVRFLREFQTNLGSNTMSWVIKIVVGGMVIWIAAKFGFKLSPEVLR